jgi:hypothetical protein
VMLEMWGGGGAGGVQDAGGGGGGGGYLRATVQVSPGAQIPVTVGTGGTPDVNCNNDGHAGGSSTFGNLLLAAGGGGGAIRFHGDAGGAGGTVTGGPFSFPGISGTNGIGGTTNGVGGASGSALLYGPNNPAYGAGTNGGSCQTGQPGHVSVRW